MNNEKLVLLALDMDDNLCDTNAFINDSLISHFKRKGQLDRVNQVKELALQMSTFLYPEDLRELIWELVIKPGHFMRQAVPTELATGTLFSKLRQLANGSNNRLKVVVCTHRGFHEHAWSNTKYWLGLHVTPGLITNIHAIKSGEYPNKLDFLQQTYPEYEIVLLDDNPFHDKTKVYEHDPRVVIYDQINRFDTYSAQRTYRGPTDLANHLANKLGLYF